MSASTRPAPLSPAERDLRSHVHTYWKAYAAQGVAQLLLGILAVAAPFAATFATVLFFGLILVAAGVAGLAGAFTMRGAAGRGGTMALSVVVLVLGIVVLADPFAGAVSLTIMIAIYFVLAAVANFALARAMRNAAGRSTLLFVAAGLNVALALFLVVGLPGTAVVAIGLILGFSFLVSGAGLLAAALGARRT